jgi:hypothetical protein
MNEILKDEDSMIRIIKEDRDEALCSYEKTADDHERAIHLGRIIALEGLLVEFGEMNITEVFVPAIFAEDRDTQVPSSQLISPEVEAPQDLLHIPT